MRLQIHVRLENDKLFLQAFPVKAKKVVFLEVLFQGIIVQVVMGLPRVPAITDEASFVFITAMLVKFIIIIESFSAKAAERMSLEPGLINRAWEVVSTPHMPL
jgi:hypothetical protein